MKTKTTRIATAAQLVMLTGLAASALPASAVDWTGYMRGGPAATSVPAKSRQCFGIGELKYRLGNECDFYGEFQLAQAMKAAQRTWNVKPSPQAKKQAPHRAAESVGALATDRPM